MRPQSNAEIATIGEQMEQFKNILRQPISRAPCGKRNPWNNYSRVNSQALTERTNRKQSNPKFVFNIKKSENNQNQAKLRRASR